MLIFLSILLFITLIVALYYQRKAWELKEEINEILIDTKKDNLIIRAKINLIRPIVEDYHKNYHKNKVSEDANAYTSMRKICDILIER